MKIVLAPDSFKHCLSAAEVCGVWAAAARETLPDAEIVSIPLADGGEGTLDVLINALDGKKIRHRVSGPLFTGKPLAALAPDCLPVQEVDAYYGLVDRDTAVIEMANICGLTMVERPNPELTSTFGVGQMLKKALDDGCKRIILCVGGSVTNDAGVGLIAALGGVFLDKNNNRAVPVGGSLSSITAINTDNLEPRLRSVEILVACDVDNPLYGERGAAYVFAPQKGADAAMVERLDKGLRSYAEVMRLHTGRDVARIPGAGAAGGITAGLLAFTGAALKPGIEIVLDTLEFDSRIAGADLIVTGEGRTDRQTLSGKTVLGVARRAKKHNIPVVVLSGAAEAGTDEALYKEGVTAVFAACREAAPFQEIKERAPLWLKAALVNILRINNSGSRSGRYSESTLFQTHNYFSQRSVPRNASSAE